LAVRRSRPARLDPAEVAAAGLLAFVLLALVVEATHPDDFLLDLYDLNPEAVRAALEQQAADLNPAWPLDELLDALTTAGVPRFAEAIRAQR
jgi:hypothetical protein